MRLRIVFPDFECRLADAHFRDFLTCIQCWLDAELDEYQYMWAFAAADRIYLRITDTSVNAYVLPDSSIRLMDLGLLQAAAFEKDRVFPSDLAGGVWSFTESDAEKFLESVSTNVKRGCPEMYLELRNGGVWKAGPMPSFSES